MSEAEIKEELFRAFKESTLKLFHDPPFSYPGTAAIDWRNVRFRIKLFAEYEHSLPLERKS